MTEADALTRLRTACLSLPEAMEQEAWGEPTFRVRNKIFAMYAGAGNHHGQGRAAVWCSAGLGVQELLVRSDPETYFVPPYVGVKGWIGIDIDRIGDADLRSHVVESYCRIAPKKLAKLVEE
ncbi:MAG TPA: MmcQ/YjbR family DNA-binding protein [Longimicrobium sp.]|nr:MmcQ/YjbR family DNA-binding protein [Longimicrobium sp.]